MQLPAYLGLKYRIAHACYIGLCIAVAAFLILPILVVVPLSFNAEPYFTFTERMLTFNPAGFSTRWYRAFWSDDAWWMAVRNSFVIGVSATAIATTLGTLGALGLSRPSMPYRSLITALLLSPMIVPLIISAAGMYFFYSRLGLSSTHLGVILAHAVLGTPFVLVTVMSTLAGFDRQLLRAAASLGSRPATTFRRITLPLIGPGVISGALLAFITSFDEVVVVLFVGSIQQRTIPWAMFSGIREQISPTILAVATILIVLSGLLLAAVGLLRRRSEMLYRMPPSDSGSVA